MDYVWELNVPTPLNLSVSKVDTRVDGNLQDEVRRVS